MTDTVLTFVLALRHPDSTAHYPDVERLLGQTLRSLDRQTDRRFRIVVVANRPYDPPADLRAPIDTVQVAFPVPPDWNGPKLAREAGVRRDKGSKIASALPLVEGGHVMSVDADDFVNVGMVEFVAARSDQVGWFVDEGLRYDVRSGLYARVRRFNEVCGTSLIVDRAQFPRVDVPRGATVEQVLDLYGEDEVLHNMGSHRFLRERKNLRPLPFRGAVYAVNNGHNVSGQSAMKLGRPMTARLAREFGITRPPRRRAAVALARGAGPGAVERARAAAGPVAARIRQHAT